MPVPKQRRRKIRYRPAAGTLARIDARAAADAFAPKLVGLVVNQSYTGCAVVTVETKPTLSVGARCLVAVGPLVPMWAEVRWQVPVDDGVWKIGLEFLE